MCANWSATRRPVTVLPKSRTAIRSGRWLVDPESGEETHKLKANRTRSRNMLTVTRAEFSSDACAYNGMGRRAMVKPVNFVLHFRGEADTVQFVTAAQAAHGLADLTDFADLRMRIAVFDVDARAWVNTFRRVVNIVRNIGGPVFDEIVFGGEPPALDYSPSGIQKVLSFGFRHIEIDGLEKPAADEALTQIAQHRIARTLPLLH